MNARDYYLLETSAGICLYRDYTESGACSALLHMDYTASSGRTNEPAPAALIGGRGGVVLGGWYD